MPICNRTDLSLPPGQLDYRSLISPLGIRLDACLMARFPDATIMFMRDRSTMPCLALIGICELALLSCVQEHAARAEGVSLSQTHEIVTPADVPGGLDSAGKAGVLERGKPPGPPNLRPCPESPPYISQPCIPAKR